MHKGLLAGAVAGMGLLVSPDHLRLWGNLAGQLGPFFWFAALGAVGLYALSTDGYKRLAAIRPVSSGYIEALHSWGGEAAAALALGSRLVLTLGLVTGVLVTAGFVFNETFVYWFPNFAFAFLWLAAVALSLLWGYRAAEKVQAGLLAVALAGLAMLIVVGFWKMGVQPLAKVASSSVATPGTLAGALLLFVGFDLGIQPSNRTNDPNKRLVGMRAALGIALVFLGLWATISLAHVPPDRLAGSFMPHTLAARKIGGQTGRILIGIVVIAGAGCASMALFSAVARMATTLARLRLLPRFLEGSGQRNIPAVSLTAGSVAGLMAAGFAGQPELEVLIRAGFLLWLLHIALVHLVAYRATQRYTSGSTDVQRRWQALLHIPAGLLAMAGTVCLWLVDEQRGSLTLYMLAAFFGTTAMLYAGRWAWPHQSSIEK